jgi:hypothetical protein
MRYEGACQVSEEGLELIPKDLIRIETALSRFPIHRLAKQGNVSIEIRETKPNGELRTKWEVTHNSKYGQPGPLAYKLDTLVINRKIDEEGRPVPKKLRLGSLHEIANTLGLQRNTNEIKKALRQNAFAGITAKISYRQTNGTEQTVEADFTRYSVFFRGERFPDGTKADAVYLVLNDIFAQIINTAPTRPLDYDYLKELPPAPQRFYELLSFQMYAAIKYRHPHAKLQYSEYCTYAPQTRYFDWEHVRKQMYKVHAPHLKSGYLAKVEFQEYQAGSGEPDWMMLYVPGPKARAEHRASQLKLGMTPRRGGEQPELPAAAEAGAESLTPEDENLVSQLTNLGVAESKARKLIGSHREATEAQIAAYPYRDAAKARKNAAGWLIAAIEGNYTLPVAYLEEQEKKRQASKAREQKSAVEGCRFCDENGWRRIRTPDYPGGAMKRCTHDPKVEAKYADA